MYLLLIILMVLASVLMCFIVLIQNSKGGGLASGFSSSNQIMGVRKTTDFLEKATWGLAAFMVVCSVAVAYSLHGHVENAPVSIQQVNKAENPNQLPAGAAVPSTTELPTSASDSTSK